MKKILITGGAGFLGSNLCKKLIKDNFIYCLDNLFCSDIKNIKPFLNNKNFKFIKHNIINEIDLEIDEIYNLACPASPPKYQIDPIYTLKTSIIGIDNLLQLATRQNAKILQASTSEVYGNPKEHPQKECYFGNVNPNGIRSCYDEGKRCAETLMFDYKRKFDTRIKIARIFNTYGENMAKDDGRVVSNFINQALSNEDITIYGNGLQTRSFCYVDDLTDGLIKLMNSNDNVTGPINLGNEEEYTIKETAELIIKKTNSKSKLIFMPLPQDDPVIRKPDTTLAKNILNWHAKTNFNKGLDNTIKYFKETK